MQIRQLKVLRTVITTGTTTQAAEILNITQPAVSSVISNFERELGFALFEQFPALAIATSHFTLSLGKGKAESEKDGFFGLAGAKMTSIF